MSPIKVMPLLLAVVTPLVMMSGVARAAEPSIIFAQASPQHKEEEHKKPAQPPHAAPPHVAPQPSHAAPQPPHGAPPPHEAP